MNKNKKIKKMRCWGGDDEGMDTIWEKNMMRMMWVRWAECVEEAASMHPHAGWAERRETETEREREREEEEERVGHKAQIEEEMRMEWCGWEGEACYEGRVWIWNLFDETSGVYIYIYMDVCMYGWMDGVECGERVWVWMKWWRDDDDVDRCIKTSLIYTLSISITLIFLSR